MSTYPCVKTLHVKSSWELLTADCLLPEETHCKRPALQTISCRVDPISNIAKGPQYWLSIAVSNLYRWLPFAGNVTTQLNSDDNLVQLIL